MIRESSIALGELIAVTGASIVPSTIIEGLNGESIGAMAYTDDFRKEIVATTSNGMHTETLEAASDRLAEIIRNSMNNIRDYGVPLASKIVNATNLLYSKGRLESLTTDMFRVSFINIDDPFFKSALYPAEVRDKSLSYTSVDLRGLERLQFEWPEDSAVRQFIDSSHPDMLEIIANQDESLNNAASFLSNINELGNLFENKDGVFDFSKVKTLRVNLLLKMYVLLTKMYAKEDPVPWLKVGDLATYRSFVNLMWNGMTLYLIHLRAVVESYKARNLVLIQEKPVRLTDHPNSNFKDTRFMSGEVRAYYTNDMLDRIDAAHVSFGEMIKGYFWANLTGGSLSLQAVIDNPSLGAGQAKEYYASIHERLTLQSTKLFVAGGLKAIGDFIAETPALSARVGELRKNSTDMMSTWLQKNFYSELEKAHYVIADKLGDGDMLMEEGAEDPRLEVVLSTPLVPVFLRACGAQLAADIIEDTFITTADCDNIADKRERLHVSVINLIVSRALDKA